MKAVVLRAFGGPERLELATVDTPQPGDGEMLVKVAATSVNPIDYKTRSGALRFMIGEDRLPLILGRDVAGIVEQVGPGVTGIGIGTHVYARPDLDRGSYAQYIRVKPGELAAAPRSLPLADAGAVPLAALTAWQGLEAGGLASGQRVLVHGAAGGVGHLAVQFARVLGATVFATCSARDLAFVRDLGAERAIDYRDERFEDIVRHVDLVLDLVGGEVENRSWAVLKPGGALISPLGKPDEEKARRARARPTGQLFVRSSSDDLGRVASLIDEGRVRVTITGRYPLEKVADAQAALEKGGIRGKLLVTVSEG